MSSQMIWLEILNKKRDDKRTNKQTNRQTNKQTNKQTNYLGQLCIEIRPLLRVAKMYFKEKLINRQSPSVRSNRRNCNF